MHTIFVKKPPKKPIVIISEKKGGVLTINKYCGIY